jgi:hypothetical protein
MPTSESKLPHQSASELGVIDSPWKNKKFTHSEVVMTTMRAIEFLPNLLLAMFIGEWVDRSNKKGGLRLRTCCKAGYCFFCSSYLMVGIGGFG